MSPTIESFTYNMEMPIVNRPAWLLRSSETPLVGEVFYDEKSSVSKDNMGWTRYNSTSPAGYYGSYGGMVGQYGGSNARQVGFYHR